MSSVNGSISKSNMATLETDDREMTGHLPPPPPPPPSFYNGQDYRAVRGLDTLGRGRGGVPSGDAEDLEFLMQEEFSEYEVEESAPESVASVPNVEEEEVSTASADSVETAPKAAVEAPAAPTAEEKQEFLGEIRGAKNDFKEIVEANEDLSPEQKQQLIDRFNEQADALGSASDLGKARDDLANLPTRMEGEIQTAVDSAKEARNQNRQALFGVITQSTQEPKFREDGGHWRHIGWALGEKFDTALQTGNWTDFNTAVNALHDGDQRFVPIMRLVSAIYRTAGRDEAKAIEMINNFLPKETVEALINKVTEASENLNWRGQGWPDDQNQVGDDKWHQWTPSETAAFLRRSLAARRDSDPYAPMTEASSAS